MKAVYASDFRNVFIQGLACGDEVQVVQPRMTCQKFLFKCVLCLIILKCK